MVLSILLDTFELTDYLTRPQGSLGGRWGDQAGEDGGM